MLSNLAKASNQQARNELNSYNMILEPIFLNTS